MNAILNLMNSPWWLSLTTKGWEEGEIVTLVRDPKSQIESGLTLTLESLHKNHQAQ